MPKMVRRPCQGVAGAARLSMRTTRNGGNSPGRSGDCLLVISTTILLSAFASALSFDTIAWSLSNQFFATVTDDRTLIRSIAAGVEIGLKACQEQFKWDVWNCSREAFFTFQQSGRHPATREKAFVHAIVSAAVTHTLTRNCSLGHFKSCSCDQSRKASNAFLLDKQWTWGGCSDNVRFGERMAKKFLDTHERSTDTGPLNLHNNRAGRWAVKKTMHKVCRCHGVSGSCALSTCWMRLGDMRTVATRLRRAFDKAQRIDYNGANLLTAPPVTTTERPKNKKYSVHRMRRPNKTFVDKDDSGNDASAQKRGQPGLPYKKNTLIYSFESAHRCGERPPGAIGLDMTPDQLANHMRGRECSLRQAGEGVPEHEVGSCKRLCFDCGLTTRTEIVRQRSPCRCKFFWCCNVTCDTCITDITRTYCT